MNADLLGLIMLRAPVKRIEMFVEPLNKAMADWYVDESPIRMAMFLAQVAHECNEFSQMRENLNYSAAGLLQYFPTHFTAAEAAAYARQPERIANRVYANRYGNRDEASGDGCRYRGGGGIQVTFHDNFLGASRGCFEDDRLIQDPESIAEPAVAMDVSGWFFAQKGLNEIADSGDFMQVTRIITGKKTGEPNGWPERLEYLERAKTVLGV